MTNKQDPQHMSNGELALKGDGTSQSFRLELWGKARPIILHLAISLLLSTAFTVAGIALYVSEYCLEAVPAKLGLAPPDKSNQIYFGMFATGDFWLMVVLWYAFILYTLVEVLISMTVGVVDAATKKKNCDSNAGNG